MIFGATDSNYNWVIVGKTNRHPTTRVYADLLEVTQTGALVFKVGAKTVHVRAPNTYSYCDQQDAWGMGASHVEDCS